MRTNITALQGGKYRIDSLLGSGGFGNTYLAEQVALGRKVAVKEFFMKEYCDRDETTSKILVPTEGSRQIVERYKQKFLKEAQMIAALKNEHIIQIYDIFEENNTAYYVMEYINGGSLKEKVEADGAMTESDALQCVRQVADALSYLHSQNILHLDVKPANILLDKDSARAVLIDFGISKHYDSEGGQTSTTPAGISKGYAPIEQYQPDGMANFSPATDIYSLGATLLFMLTAVTPPDAMTVTNDGLDDEVVSVLPDSVKDAILASMQARRKDRPQIVSAFLGLIKPIAVEKAPVRRTDEDTVMINSKKKPVKLEEKHKKLSKWFTPIVVAVVVVAALGILLPKLVEKSPSVQNLTIQIPGVSESQVDTVNYLLGVNFGSFIKSNGFANSLDELDWAEIRLGIKDFIAAEGSPYDDAFSRQFKIDPDHMTDEFNDYLEMKKSGVHVNALPTSYLMGVSFGSFIKQNKFAKSDSELKYALIKKGIEDALNAVGDSADPAYGKQFDIDPTEMNDVFDSYITTRLAYCAKINKAEGEKFLKKNALKDDVKVTSSGLQYTILDPGGTYKVSPQDTVVVNYEGTYIDGTVFDEGHYVEFATNQVIKGWTEGLGLIGVGGHIKLYIPSELAYGEKGVNEIEPNTVLVFDVELLNVKRKRN